MNTVLLKLVTIVAEAVVEDRLLREIQQLGARGYTVTSVRGQGSRGVRASDWEGASARIETLVAPEVASQIFDHLTAHYFENYAVVAYAQDVEVVRGEKYL